MGLVREQPVADTNGQARRRHEGAGARPERHLALNRPLRRIRTLPRVMRLGRAVGWRLAVPALRARARRRLDRLQTGAATVITVNWNSSEHLEVLIDMVRRTSPRGTRILVVDNGSDELINWRDGGPPAGVSVWRLPLNLYHDLALDLGVLRCKSEFFVVLDVDAFPLRDGWLEELLTPLDQGAQVSGALQYYGPRTYVHPCCLAMRTARFVQQKHSFRHFYSAAARAEEVSDGEPWRSHSDVGEQISAREAPHVHYLEVTSQRGPGDLGSVFGGLVYHNFYGTRFDATPETSLEMGVTRMDAELAWDEAVRRYVLDEPDSAAGGDPAAIRSR
jgi:hypothetical protein